MIRDGVGGQVWGVGGGSWGELTFDDEGEARGNAGFFADRGKTGKEEGGGQNGH